MTKREERWAADYGWIRDIVQSNLSTNSTALHRSSRPKAVYNASNERRPFDVSSFKMTPAALALLKKVEDREQGAEGEESIADANERKYGEQLTYADRLMEKKSEKKNNRYARIEGMAGRNGDCHSRKTTYRHQKYGKGNLSLRGYLKEGFEENISCRAL